MKYILFLFSLIGALCLNAAESHESFAYHSFTVKDRDFNVQDEFHGDGAPLGLILNAYIDDTQYIAITLGENTIYEVQVVNEVTDQDFAPGYKCLMYQGGMSFQGEIVAINILFIYNLSRNTEIPDTVLVDVNNSPTIMELSGLVKLNTSTR